MPVRPPWSYTDSKQQLEDRERKAFDEWCRKLTVRERGRCLALWRPSNPLSAPKSRAALTRCAGEKLHHQ